MTNESVSQRSQRILGQLRNKFPGKTAFDLDGRGLHFVCEIEPTTSHPEFDKAVEVIIDSKPHKHLKMTQKYTILSGSIELFVNDDIYKLEAGDTHIIEPGKIHWAKSKDECWLEIFSTPGWTKEDHILVNN